MHPLLYIPIISIIITAIVAMLERRMVWAYSGPEPGPAYPDQGGYAAFHVDQAMSAGFRPLVWTKDMKGGMYKVSYAFLVSPDGDTLAIIGAGSIASLPVFGTWLYSSTLQGVLSYSTDRQSCVEVDISGVTKCQLVPDASFMNLYMKHREWLHDRGIIPHPFPAGAEMDTYRTLLIGRRKTMQKTGLITFADPSEVYWRYTVIGAVKLAVTSFFVGLLRAVTFGKLPRTA